jgi:protein disulfide-isomerase A6
VTCTAFGPEPSVTMAMLDATTAPALRARYNITGYPKLLLFPEDREGGQAAGEKTPIMYTGPRKHRDMLDFLNAQAGTQRLANGTLGTTAALVPSLDLLITTAESYTAPAFLEQLESAIAALEGEEDSTSAQRYALQLYRSYARKVAAKGEEYPQQELQRLTRLVENPLTPTNKAEEFIRKRNIITQFLGAEYLSYANTPGLVQALDRLIAAAPALDEDFAAELERVAGQINMDTSQYVLYAKKIAGNGEGCV